MGYFYFLSVIILSLIHVHCTISVVTSNNRQAIEITIGGGISVGGSNGGDDGDSTPVDCPPPPPPPPSQLDCPPPLLSPEPASQRPSPPPKSLSRPHKRPSSPKSQPLVFLDQRLFAVYPVIQNFRKLITSDPLGITKTWVGADICNKYKGFYCDTPPDNSSATALASIDFSGYQLGAPSLEGFLDALPDLALFHANTNNFSGTISSKILKLRYLYELDISNNKFSGAFPSALFAPNNLIFLDIRYNFFSGSIPPQIFNRNLQVLFVNNNNFVAQLPPNFGTTPVLYLTLANKLTGQIPSSIGKATALTEVLFLNNQFSGCLPYEIGYLETLTVFDVGNNQLTGLVPCSFGCLDNIEQLNLAGNMFYGEVPEIVCALKNLLNFSLSDNYFTRVGPFCRDLIQRGVLDLNNNCVPGLPFQRSPIDCAVFFSHPRWCPYPRSYNFIPCKPSYSSNPSAKTPPSSSKAPSPTFSALIRHRL